MPNSKTKKSKSSSARRQSNVAISRRMNPPPLKTNIIGRHTFRFVSTNGSATDITAISTLFVVGGLCAPTGYFTGWAESVKVHSIQIWTPYSTGSSPINNTCSVKWNADTFLVPNVEVSDTTTSSAFPAYINAVPPPRSSAAEWMNTSSFQDDSSIYCTVTAPNNSIIDVDLSYVLYDEIYNTGGANPNILNLTAYNSTYAYYGSFDGMGSIGTHRYTPVSLSTTN
jgi:hypothetical protein